MQSNFYTFKANSLSGEEIDFADYKDHVVLIVNTASKCGFTPQYEGLEELYTKLKDQKLVILGFPCNQFGGQEPGSSKDIQEGCLINYGVSFPMFEKIDVNGKNAHPLFDWLKKEKSGFLGGRIKWNFTKFLLDKNGQVIDRYGSMKKPKELEGDIIPLL